MSKEAPTAELIGLTEGFTDSAASFSIDETVVSTAQQKLFPPALEINSVTFPHDVTAYEVEEYMERMGLPWDGFIVESSSGEGSTSYDGNAAPMKRIFRNVGVGVVLPQADQERFPEQRKGNWNTYFTDTPKDLPTYRWPQELRYDLGETRIAVEGRHFHYGYVTEERVEEENDSGFVSVRTVPITWVDVHNLVVGDREIEAIVTHVEEQENEDGINGFLTIPGEHPQLSDRIEDGNFGPITIVQAQRDNQWKNWVVKPAQVKEASLVA